MRRLPPIATARRLPPLAPSGVPQAFKLPYLGDAARALDPSIILPTISDQGNGKTRVTIPAASSGVYTAINAAAAWYFQCKDVDGADTGGSPRLYDWTIGVELTAPGGGLADDDIWAAALVYSDPDPALADVAVGVENGFGAGVFTSGGAAGALSIAGRGGAWNRNDGGTDAAVRVALGKTRIHSTEEGYVGAVALGSATFDSAVLSEISYNLVSAGSAGVDYATVVVLVGTRVVLGADVDVDVQTWVEAVRFASPQTGLTARGFGS